MAVNRSFARKHLAFWAASAMALSSASVQAQTQPQTQLQGQPGSIFGELLGNILGLPAGSEQSMDAEWARGRQPIGQRRTDLDARIDADERSGALTRAEADRLRYDHDQIVRLEQRYAADRQFTTQERADLRDRYAALLGQMDQGGQDNAQGPDGWEPLAQRRAEFDRRIEVAVRANGINRNEATQLRYDYDQLVRLEQRHRADGRLTPQEADELEGRYEELSERIGDDRPAYDDFDRWEPLAERRDMFEERLEAALRNRMIARPAAMRLRTDFQMLLQVEAGYQRSGGIDAREQADLNARYDALNRRMGYQTGYADDRNSRRWAEIESRIVAGERAGVIQQAEAARLRTELEDLSRLDDAYRADGLAAEERQYMARRFGELEARVRNARRR